MAQAHNTRTFGASIGAALGKTAAYGVHGAISAAQYTGRFGQDVAAGATQAYAETAAELAARRAAAAAARPMLALDDEPSAPATPTKRDVKKVAA
mgnify:CR=1 FL=1